MRGISKFFMIFFVMNVRNFADENQKEITLDDISRLEAEDIEEYLEYLKYYEKDGKIYTNAERAIKRKLSSLRVFYGYICTKMTGFLPIPQKKLICPKYMEKLSLVWTQMKLLTFWMRLNLATI